MAVPKLSKQEIVNALKFIDEKGVPEHNVSMKYVLVSENGKTYPPKYVVAVVSCIGAVLGSATLNLILGYYQ